MPVSDVELPDKVFFRIGEVARLTGVKAYVLRYWETEFKTLRPKKSQSGQRLYRKSDIGQVLRIKDLLWNRKFTIVGARSELNRSRTTPGVQSIGQGAGLSATDSSEELTAPEAQALRSPAPAPVRPSGPVGQDPKLLRRVEELTVHSEKLAARAEIAERDASALRGLADRQRKDLTTVRETLKLLRSNLASFLEESQGR